MDKHGEHFKMSWKCTPSKINNSKQKREENMKNKSKSLMNMFISMFAVFAIVITFSLRNEKVITIANTANILMNIFISDFDLFFIFSSLFCFELLILEGVHFQLILKCSPCLSIKINHIIYRRHSWIEVWRS